VPTYRYKAISLAGQTVKGKTTVADATMLMDRLEADGLFLVSSREVTERKGLIRGKLSSRDLMELTANLKAMVEAGITMIEALETLAADASTKRTQRLLLDIADRISKGNSLSFALSAYPRMFPPLYVRTVAVGEVTGNLGYVLGQMVAFLNWKLRLQSDIRQALIYPAFLGGATLVVVAVLMSFVVPRFQEILRDLNIPLPGITLMVLGFSNFVVTKWPLILLGAVGLVVGYVVANRIPATKAVIDDIKLRLPVLGPFNRAVAVSRFMRNLMVPYVAGVEIMASVEMMEKTVGNSRFEAAARELRERIQAGGTLAEGIRRTGLFPKRVITMIDVGERIGRLGEMLERVGEHYDEEIPRRVKRVMAVLEPTFLLINAVIVLIVALSVILPIYRVNISGLVR
jgi:type II secretory pathway component PulF